VLLITSQAEAEAMMENRVYPVGDLVETDEDGLVVMPERGYESLIDVITRTLEPTSWDDVGGPGSIVESPGSESLVISQAAYVHDEIEHLLSSLRQAREDQPRREADPPGEGEKGMILKVYRVPEHWPDTLADAAAINAARPANQRQPADGRKELKVEADDGVAVPAGIHPQFDIRCAGVHIVKPLTHDPVVSARQLAEVIPAVIEPESWESAGGQGVIHAVAGSLLVRQSKSVHRQIRQLLTAIE
jgi:hypothetical protein